MIRPDELTEGWQQRAERRLERLWDLAIEAAGTRDDAWPVILVGHGPHVDALIAKYLAAGWVVTKCHGDEFGNYVRIDRPHSGQ